MNPEDFRTIKEFPKYEINSDGVVRNKKTRRCLKVHRNYFVRLVKDKKNCGCTVSINTLKWNTFRNDKKSKNHPKFETIKEFPNYEINIDGVIRNRSTGRIMKGKELYGLYKDGKQYGRSINTLKYDVFGIQTPITVSTYKRSLTMKESERKKIKWSPCFNRYRAKYIIVGVCVDLGLHLTLDDAKWAITYFKMTMNLK